MEAALCLELIQAKKDYTFQYTHPYHKLALPKPSPPAKEAVLRIRRPPELKLPRRRLTTAAGTLPATIINLSNKPFTYSPGVGLFSDRQTGPSVSHQRRTLGHRLLARSRAAAARSRLREALTSFH